MICVGFSPTSGERISLAPMQGCSSQPSREDFGVSWAGPMAMALETRVVTPPSIAQGGTTHR